MDVEWFLLLLIGMVGPSYIYTLGEGEGEGDRT
jgi:hypothetical protein